MTVIGASAAGSRLAVARVYEAVARPPSDEQSLRYAIAQH
jgi:hypothetical protein